MMAWFQSPGRRARLRPTLSFRPAVGYLEDRCLLAGNVLQTNLVSDLPGVATVLDPNLVNPWGISASATGPFWVANNGSGTSSVYNSAGTPRPIAAGQNFV